MNCLFKTALTRPQGKTEAVHKDGASQEIPMAPHIREIILIIQIIEQLSQNEIESQLPILSDRLAYKDPLRSNSNGSSSSKRGNRGGAMTNGKAGRLGARIDGDGGTIRYPTSIRTAHGHARFYHCFFLMQCESTCIPCFQKDKFRLQEMATSM